MYTKTCFINQVRMGSTRFFKQHEIVKKAALSQL